MLGREHFVRKGWNRLQITANNSGPESSAEEAEEEEDEKEEEEEAEDEDESGMESDEEDMDEQAFVDFVNEKLEFLEKGKLYIILLCRVKVNVYPIQAIL